MMALRTTSGLARAVYGRAMPTTTNVATNATMRFYSDERKKQQDYLLLQAIRGGEECLPRGEEEGEEKEDPLNSVRTLPRYDVLKSEEQLRRELLASRPDGAGAGRFDGVVVHYRRARNVFRFFKEGLANVWRVNRAVRRGVFGGRRWVADYSPAATAEGASSGGRHVVGRGDFAGVVDEVSGRVALLQIEYERGRRGAAEFLGRGPGGREVLLSRREFVEMVRDRANFVKLPLFGALFLVLEELSLPLLYVFPQLLPGTCVLPGVLERRYHARGVRAFRRLLEEADGGMDEAQCRDYVQAVAMNRANNTPLLAAAAGSDDAREERARVRAVCHVIHCRGTTRAALREHQKVLLADDYLLVADGGVARLSAAEVVHGCAVRGLTAGSSGGFGFGSGETSPAPTDVAGLRAQLGRWLDVRFGLV